MTSAVRTSSRIRGVRSTPLLAAAAVIALGGCAALTPPAPLEPSAFGTGTAEITTSRGPVTVDLWIAETERQKEAGLAGWQSLPENAGMYFVFDEAQPADSGFWMFGTSLSLSIAFIGPDGSIVGIQAMEPCYEATADRCPQHLAGAVYTAALEVNQGFFARNGIVPGDRLVLRRESATDP